MHVISKKSAMDIKFRSRSLYAKRPYLVSRLYLPVLTGVPRFLLHYVSNEDDDAADWLAG